jgi:hypothetical protein
MNMPKIKFIVLGAVVMIIGYFLYTTIFWNGMMLSGDATINGVALVPTYQIPGVILIIIGLVIVAFAFYNKKQELPVSK